MSKPILPVKLISAEGKAVRTEALFDTGSFYSIIHEAALPRGTTIIRYSRPRKFGTAKRGSRVRIAGSTELVVELEKRRVLAHILVSPDLSRPAIVGAETMQAWDISIKNRNGHTKAIIGRDMRDPEITEVD